VALVPYAFYFVTFGKPSLITADYTNPANIGLGRTASLLFDLNQGLLPYVRCCCWPRSPGRGCDSEARRAGVLALLALAGMLVGVQVQNNWNSGASA